MKGCVFTTRTVKQPSKHCASYANGTLLCGNGEVDLYLVCAGRCVFSLHALGRGGALTVGESPFSTFIKGAFSIVTTTA